MAIHFSLLNHRNISTSVPRLCFVGGRERKKMKKIKEKKSPKAEIRHEKFFFFFLSLSGVLSCEFSFESVNKPGEFNLNMQCWHVYRIII